MYERKSFLKSSNNNDCEMQHVGRSLWSYLSVYLIKAVRVVAKEIKRCGEGLSYKVLLLCVLKFKKVLFPFRGN